MQENHQADKLAKMGLKESEEIFHSFSEQSFVGIYLMQDGRLEKSPFSNTGSEE